MAFLIYSVCMTETPDSHDSTLGAPTLTSSGPQEASARKVELGNIAINRILFALALLGVLLPLNTIISHYSHFGFIYYAPHEVTLKGPYNIHIRSFLYAMEGILAFAVYLYGFEFIFSARVTFFQLVGNLFYALALLVPPTYFYLWLWALLLRAVNSFGTLAYWLIITITVLIFAIPFAIIYVVIVKRLQAGRPLGSMSTNGPRRTADRPPETAAESR